MGLFTFMAVREGLITSRSGVLLPCGRPRPIQHAVASAKFASRHPHLVTYRDNAVMSHTYWIG